MNRITKTTPPLSGYCKKSCHDCPFRTDTPKYMGVEDVQNNIMYVINPEMVPVCHHTSTELGRTGPEKGCAGALLFIEKLGLKKPQVEGWKPLKLNTTVPVYENLDDFAINSAARDQSWEARMEAWIECQPAHKRAEERVKLERVLAVRRQREFEDRQKLRRARMLRRQEEYDLGGGD